MCEAEGKLTPATVVDHIVPHRGDRRLFWDKTNWQPLCKRCHDVKTLTEDVRPELSFEPIMVADNELLSVSFIASAYGSA
jgi:hypothetical protein